MRMGGGLGLGNRSRRGRYSPLALFAAGEKGVWYNAGSKASLFQDSAGTTPVAADSDPVGRLTDLGPNAINAVQATAGLRPLYKVGTGANRLQFDLADDKLTATFAQSLTGDMAYSGPNGMWVEDAITTNAAGTRDIGVTDGPKTQQIIRALGGLHEFVYLGRTMTANERSALGSRYGGYLQQEAVERVINGAFPTDISNWTLDGTPTTAVSSGVLTITATGANEGLWQVIPVKPGVPHILNLPAIGTNGFVYIYDAATLTNVFAGAPLNNSSTKPLLFLPTGPQIALRLFVLNGNSATFDNLSIRRLRRDPNAALAWANLEWASFGDSLTAQTQWQPYVAGDHVIRNTSYGVGGTKIGGSDAQSFWQDARVNTLSTTARLVTVLGGTNDWVQATPLGTIGSSDTTTFYGALNTLHPKLVARCPSAKIAYVTPPYSEMLDFASRAWPNKYTNAIGLTIADYAAALRAWALANGRTLFDVNAQCGINAGNNTTYMTNDGNLIHPNAAGGALVGAVVTAGLQQLAP